MRPLRGIALKLGSVLVFIVMSAMIKTTAQHVPAGQTVFFRSAFAIPVIVVWLAWRHELTTGFRAKNPIGHIWRGLMGTLAMGMGFAGLAYLPLPEVTAIGYAAPLLVVVFAAMFLGENVRAFRLAMVALGLTAAVLGPQDTPPDSPVAGLVVVYFVATGWAMARRREARIDRFGSSFARLGRGGFGSGCRWRSARRRFGVRLGSGLASGERQCRQEKIASRHGRISPARRRGSAFRRRAR